MPMLKTDTPEGRARMGHLKLESALYNRSVSKPGTCGTCEHSSPTLTAPFTGGIDSYCCKHGKYVAPFEDGCKEYEEE